MRYWRSTRAKPARAWPCRKRAGRNRPVRMTRCPARTGPTMAAATTAGTRPRRRSAATCGWSSSGPARRADEPHQLAAAQHQPAHVPVLAVLGILEPERALQAEAPVVAAAQAQPGGVHRLVQPLHPARPARVAADFL